ncbi:thiol-disulfide oxidoreductase DCC family protein [Maricaulis sp. CAU 1757]
MTQTRPGPVIAYYDALCPICVREMRHYSRFGEHIIKLQDCNGDIPDDVDRDAALEAMHVRLPSGELVTGWNAFIAIWERLPGWHWLAMLTRPAPIRIPLDWVYRRLAPYRPRRTCRDGACET